MSKTGTDAREDSRRRYRPGGRHTGGAGRAGVTAILGGAVAIAALHLVGPGNGISPLRRTISEYQLTEVAWIFNAAVLLIAAGAALVLRCALRTVRVAEGGRRTTSLRAATVLSALAVAGLVAVVAFTKQDWSQARNLAGSLHRAGSLMAFICLPLAVLTLVGATLRRGQDSRRGRESRRGQELRHEPGEHRARTWAMATIVFAVAGLAHFLPLLIAIAMHGAWWMGVPLGLVERGMAVCEFAALLTLAGWCASAGSRTGRPTGERATAAPVIGDARQSAAPTAVDALPPRGEFRSEIPARRDRNIPQPQP